MQAQVDESSAVVAVGAAQKVSWRANSFELSSVYVVGGHTGAAHQCSVEVWNAHTRGSTAATAQWKPVSSLEQVIILKSQLSKSALSFTHTDVSSQHENQSVF